jgi:predicted enzyme related to lactoylglutathione lyase
MTALRYAISTLAMLAFAFAAPLCVHAQPPRTPPVSGIYNWVHTTGDAERAFAFYHDVFGLELARSPFAAPAAANAPPERIRPKAQAGSDPLVWDLTDTKGARFRTVFMRASNTPFGLELSEFFDIPRETRAANPWDPGVSTLVFAVRDLAAVAARVRAAGTPIVTLGGAPLDTPQGRSLLLRDTDGYLVQATQASPTELAVAEPGEVVRTSIAIAVADTQAALGFYGGLLGFAIAPAQLVPPSEMLLYGLAAGALTETTTVIPGTQVTVLLREFALAAEAPESARPFRWRIQDVGAPQLQLGVRRLDSLLAETRQAGYRIVSVNERPIERAFGRFVFVADADSVLVEFVEPNSVN